MNANETKTLNKYYFEVERLDNQDFVTMLAYGKVAKDKVDRYFFGVVNGDTESEAITRIKKLVLADVVKYNKKYKDVFYTEPFEGSIEIELEDCN